MRAAPPRRGTRITYRHAGGGALADAEKGDSPLKKRDSPSFFGAEFAVCGRNGECRRDKPYRGPMTFGL